MLETVDVGERRVEAYRDVAPERMLDELARASAELQGARVLHLNATPYGGGVSELLRSIVPLLNDLGLIADWKVISGNEAFFDTTKAIHNGLQGARGALTKDQEAIYVSNAERNARRLEEQYDFVFVHDPQPAAILPLGGARSGRWVWRCHIDTSQPDPDVWGFVRGFLGDYDAAIFTMAEFVAPDLPIGRVEIIPPAIDPLSPKNLPLPDETARELLAWIGLSTERPLVTQVSRFDPWKDPLGVIEAFRLAREEVSHAELALVGSMALDDPEGWNVYRRISEEASKDPRIHVFTNLTGVGATEVNAFQRLSDVVVQKSTREGFGLVVSEALWKQTPVVAGRAGGIPLQMADGIGGVLVDTVEQCAEGIAELLGDPARAHALGLQGQKRVREHFLLPRLLLNELSLMLDVARVGLPRTARGEQTRLRDPVCGMAVIDGEAAPSTKFEGRSFVFCSHQCKSRFLEQPAHYARSWSRGV